MSNPARTAALRVLRPLRVARSSAAGPSRLPLLAPAVRTFRTSPARSHAPIKPVMAPAAEAPGSVAPSPTAMTLSAADYEKHSNETMETLHDQLEALVEEYSPEGANGWECEYSSGVLTMSLGPHGTYVINKQPPNQQIWLSSPFSGPMRFSFISPTSTSSSSASAQGVWTYARDEVTLGALLDREIRSVLVSEVGQEEADAWVGSGVE